ncbi:MAG: hypothetical protein ACJAUD_001466 [Crocinitomicaceae bacterium]|jgi:hypothetical protein
MFIALTHISTVLDYKETSLKFTKAFLVIGLLPKRCSYDPDSFHWTLENFMEDSILF